MTAINERLFSHQPYAFGNAMRPIKFQPALGVFTSTTHTAHFMNRALYRRKDTACGGTRRYRVGNSASVPSIAVEATSIPLDTESSGTAIATEPRLPSAYPVNTIYYPLKGNADFRSPSPRSGCQEKSRLLVELQLTECLNLAACDELQSIAPYTSRPGP
jgi:hypothetical protein